MILCSQNQRARGLTLTLLGAVAVWVLALTAVIGQETKPEETASAPPPPPPAEAPARLGYVIPVAGEITDITRDSLKRRIDEARAAGARVIVFDLNTPGGLVTSTLDITHMIRNLEDIKTVAWVNPTAYSGGAIFAIACDEIVMTPSSTIGDAQVIIGGPDGVGAVPEALEPKILTPVLAEIRASARLNGYSQVLCEAFVLPEREVWWLQNTQTGEREFVFREDKVKRIVDDEDMKPSGVAEAARALLKLDDEPEWKLVETFHDVVLKKDVPTIQPVVQENRLLQMSCSEAHAYGFNKELVSNQTALKARYTLTDLVLTKASWSENLAGWLTSMYVRGFLLLVILLAAYVEFNTPGVGVAGLVALIGLAIFVGAPYLTGLASVWEIALILVGILLIGLEIFVIPGFGVAGISGVALVLIGLLATFVPDEPNRTFPLFTPSLPVTVEWIKQGIVVLGGSLTASVVGMFILAKFLPHTRAFSLIAPANPTPSQVRMDDPYAGAARLGDCGFTVGPLRPAGKARFGSTLVDVVSEGDFVEGDVKIEVVERRGNHVTVRPVTA